jgi:hypothetical protein
MQSKLNPSVANNTQQYSQGQHVASQPEGSSCSLFAGFFTSLNFSYSWELQTSTQDLKRLFGTWTKAQNVLFLGGVASVSELRISLGMTVMAWLTLHGDITEAGERERAVSLGEEYERKKRWITHISRYSGRSRQIRRDWNWMGCISLWLMLMMWIYCEITQIP